MAGSLSPAKRGSIHQAFEKLWKPLGKCKLTLIGKGFFKIALEDVNSDSDSPVTPSLVVDSQVVQVQECSQTAPILATAIEELNLWLVQVQQHFKLLSNFWADNVDEDKEGA